MIEITVWTDKAAREYAQADWDGHSYIASSRAGAVFAVARLLVAAGCPDGPWRVPSKLEGPSLHKIARLAIEDSPRGGIHQRPYHALPPGGIASTGCGDS